MFSFWKNCVFGGVVLGFSGQACAGLIIDNSVPCTDDALIASIELKGLKYTQPHVVLRELIQKVGENFSQKTFEIEKLRLQDLDLFTEITVSCEPTKESINEILAVSNEPAPEPPPSVPVETSSSSNSISPNPDTLSSFVSRLSSNTELLSSLLARLSANNDTLSSLISHLSSDTDSLSSLVTRLSSNTDSLSSLVTRLLSNIAALSSLVPVDKPVETASSNTNSQSSDKGYLSTVRSLNSYKVTYHFKEIFRWIPAPAGKKTDRDGLMLGLALANLNVLGEDIRAEVQYRTSVNPFFENNEYALYASSPYLLGLPLGWNFEFLRTNSWDDIRGFQDASWLFSLDVNWNMHQHFSILGKTAYRYLEGGPGHLPEFGLGFAIDFRDSELDSRKGVYFEGDVTHVGSGSANENFTEFLGDGRIYYSYGPFVTGATALLRMRLGEVERYDYYYHGGANTFRGHESDSLYLGINEVLLTLEERFVLLERRSASLWGINFFYGLQLVAGLDGRLLWDKGAPGWKNYEGAVYGGIHLVIPALDRIRFEVGYSPDHGEPVFHIGLFDKTTAIRWRSR